MLTETSQGSNSGQSITHDSDPRKLEFETVDSSDTQVADLGNHLDMTNVGSLGYQPAVIGPTFGDLIGAPAVFGPNFGDLGGGSGNALRLYIQRALKGTDMTVGIYAFTMRWQTSTTNVDETFNITMPDLAILMAAQPLSVNGYKIDITSLVPNWATHCAAGDKIIQIKYISITAFGGPGIIWSTSHGTLSIGELRTSDATIDPVALFPAQTTLKTDDIFAAPGPNYKCFFDISLYISGAYEITVDLPIDAAAVQAQMFSQQLALQQGGQNIYYSLLSPYMTAEYTFTNGDVVIAGAYSTATPGVEALAAVSQLAFVISGGTPGDFGQRPEQLRVIITDPTTTPPTYTAEYPQWGSWQSFTGDQLGDGPALSFDLSPKSQSSHVKIYGTDFDNNKTFDISIAALQALATPEQLASQSVTFEIPIDFGFAVYKVDYGYTAISSAKTLSGASTIGIAFDQGRSNYFHAFSELPYTTLGDYNSYPGASATKMIIHINLLPISVPEQNNPIVCTKPYELRNRNNPAFKFVFSREYGEAPEEALTVQVSMLVSQGPIDGKWSWTKTPCLEFGTTNANGFVSDLHSLAFPVNITYCPTDWSGDIIKMAAVGAHSGTDTGSYAGPWNYVKFFIHMPYNDTEEYYNGWFLDIIANAREL
jgi:hypothetical protein